MTHQRIFKMHLNFIFEMAYLLRATEDPEQGPRNHDSGLDAQGTVSIHASETYMSLKL